MSITIFHNPQCSKSRETLSLLIKSGKTFEIIEYLKSPLKPYEIKSIIKKLKIMPKDLLRNTEACNTGINNLEGHSLLRAICDNPRVMQRPIVINGDNGVICRPPEKIFEIL